VASGEETAGRELRSLVEDVRTRVRVHHSKTQRDGWGYETTVEVEWFGRELDDEMRGRLAALLAGADRLGREERERRRRDDAKEAGGGS